MMSKLGFIFVVILALASPANSQSQDATAVADTLDWHRYYPLAVGNVWEFRVAEGEPLLIHDIISDSLANDRTYYVMQRTSWDSGFFGAPTDGLSILSRDTVFVRYVDAGGVMIVDSPDVDSLATPMDTPFVDGIRGYYDLRVDFGDSVQVSSSPDFFYQVTGGYDQPVDISGQTYHPPALKNFDGGLIWEGYAIDIGLLYSQNLWGPRLTYASVDGTEYGISRNPVHTSVESVLPANLQLDGPFPNPTRGSATFLISVRRAGPVELEAFDMLGRRIWRSRISAAGSDRQPVDIAVDNWPTGTYFVRLSTEGGQSISRSITVVR